MSSDHKCPGCKKARPTGYVACKTCWNRLPFSLRSAFTKAGLAGKRAMLREILGKLTPGKS